MDNIVLLFIHGFLWNARYEKVTPSLKYLKCYLVCCIKNLKHVYMNIGKENYFEEWQPIYDTLLSEEPEE